MGPLRFRFFAAALALGLLPAAPAGAINIVLVYDDLGENPSYDSDGSRLMAIAAAAATTWERLIPSAGTHIVDVSWSDLGDGGELGLWKFDPFGNNNLYFDTDTTNGWFFDQTPLGNGEFDFGDPLAFATDFSDDGKGSYLAGDPPSSLYFDNVDPPATLEIGYLGLGKSDDAANKTDLLSVVLHELGHELGVAGDFLSGRYPLDPDHVLGIDGIEVIEGDCEGNGEGYCDEHGHVAPPLALMSPQQPAGVRTLPSAVDVLVAARDSNYQSVDLARKFTGRSGAWGDATDWIGGRVPDADDDVTIAHGGTTTVTGERTADSVWIDGNSALDATGDLTIDHELVVEGTLSSSFGSEINANSFETRANGNTVLSGGHLIIGGGIIAGGSVSSDPEVSGRGILESNGLLQVFGTISAEGGDLRLDGSGSIRLERESGNPYVPGALRAVDGNLGLDIGFAAQSKGSITVGAGRNVTALRDISIPGGTELRLSGDENAPAVLNSVGGGIQVTVNDLSVGHGEIFASDVRLQGSVDVGSHLTLSSGLRTTLADVFVGGDGTVVQDSDISIQGSVLVGVDTFDWGNSTSGESHALTIDPGATLRITSDSLGSTSGAFRGDMQIDSGVLNVETETGWTIPGQSILGAPAGSLAMIHSGASDPVIQGAPLTVNSNLIVSGGDAFIEAPLTTTTGADVFVWGNSTLFLDSPTTIGGGSWAGLGTLVQADDITVTRDTAIETETFNWGNSFGLNFHTLTVESGATLTVASPGTGDPDNDFRGGVVLNGGELIVNTDLPWTLPASGFLQTGGSLELNNVSGAAPRVGGQSLTVEGSIFAAGGASHIDSDLTMLDGSIDVAAGATLNLNGSNVYRGTFTGDGVYQHNGSALIGTSLEFPNLVQNGRLTAINPSGESLLATQTLVFEDDSDTRVFSDLRVRGDVLVMPDAGFTGNGTLIIDAAARLRGGDDLGVDLRNEGTLAPGFSPGALNIAGDFANLGTLEIELGGTLAGLTHDAIAVDGDLALEGTLELILYGGFAPVVGDSFDILDWTGVLNGAFSSFVYPLGSGPTEWDFSDLYTSGELRFVPEPGTALLVGLGLAALRRRRV